MKKRPRRLRHRRPPLTVGQILVWADHEFAVTGRWPQGHDGEVLADCTEKWRNIEVALHSGGRGLPKGNSLARLLAEHRGVRNRGALPRLTVDQILAWADHEFQATGRWPQGKDGVVLADCTEKWENIDAALHYGNRGLPQGTTLARLLAEHRGVRNRGALPPLTEEQVLAWVDRHFSQEGRWPRADDGPVPADPSEKWADLNAALRLGLRGLPGGSSLAKLLAARRGVRNSTNLPKLTEAQVLAWADYEYRQTGRWPQNNDGEVLADPTEKWRNIDMALLVGRRGLPGGSSLAKLLGRGRGVRNLGDLPDLSVRTILAWADHEYRTTGRWPRSGDGEVLDQPGEKWSAIDGALRDGRRGLRGGSSLPRLLEERRGVRNHLSLPRLMIEEILAWADDHYARRGTWPKCNSGRVLAQPTVKWRDVENALRIGLRGLEGGSSLARLLLERRGVLSQPYLPRLTERNIVAWARAHRRRTGRWPAAKSGSVADAPGEVWANLDAALREGRRGLPGGDSLSRLLARRCGRRNHLEAPPLGVQLILAWADDHHDRTGQWPQVRSGPVAAARGETWAAVEAALARGGRGLPGGSSLARLLAERRGVRNRRGLPPLREERIVAWARAERKRTGRWPHAHSGPIPEAPGESWGGVDKALRHGWRGLPGGDSLHQLLVRNRRKRG